MLYLALIAGEYVGWGVCSKYLIAELAKLTDTKVISPENTPAQIDGAVFHTIGDHNLTKVIDVTGKKNYGYTFFENLLPAGARKNAENFDTVFAGSSWCRDRLVEVGITWSDVLIQGIDPTLFYPTSDEKPGANEFFVIYSGGKFELRKGQDIVIKAVAVMQQRHKDILFVNCWHNAWAFSANTMAASRLIDFMPQPKWDSAYLEKLLVENGIDLNRTEILPRIPQNQLRKLYACTDIGLFPNRCEGGTNLVMMEYMGCAKPVVASFNSGHTDILTAQNSLMLTRMSPLALCDENKTPMAAWQEPDLEETIEKLEYAYQNQKELKALGQQAAKDLHTFTWQDMAIDLVQKLGLNQVAATNRKDV
jgi:glycosyltransferase involved in cell wall biosynthesis